MSAFPSFLSLQLQFWKLFNPMWLNRAIFLMQFQSTLQKIKKSSILQSKTFWFVKISLNFLEIMSFQRKWHGKFRVLFVRLLTTQGIHQDFLSGKEVYPAKRWAQDYDLHLTVKWGGLPKNMEKVRAEGGLDLCWWVLVIHSDHGFPFWGSMAKRKNQWPIQFRRNLKFSLQCQQFLRGILHESRNTSSCHGDDIPVTSVWETSAA